MPVSSNKDLYCYDADDDDADACNVFALEDHRLLPAPTPTLPNVMLLLLVLFVA